LEADLLLDAAFEDISPEETTKESPFSNYAEVSETNSPKETRLFEDVSFVFFCISTAHQVVI